MGIKCSLFGHAFGETTVERDREEQGSEVVSTIRELQTCTRCGERRVVSENKEVTTLETPSDIVGDELSGEGGSGVPDEATGDTGPDRGGAADAADAAGGAGGGDPDPGPGTASVPSAETDTATGTDAVSEATTAPEPDVAASADADPDPEEDDGVILDDDDGEDDDGRAPGEWPGEEDEDTGSGDHAGETDAVAEWPEEENEDGDDWAPETDSDTPTEVEPTSTAVTVPEGTFHCPECEFSTPVEDSSLRAGDFCPECHRGSLEHRT